MKPILCSIDILSISGKQPWIHIKVKESKQDYYSETGLEIVSILCCKCENFTKIQTASGDIRSPSLQTLNNTGIKISLLFSKSKTMEQWLFVSVASIPLSDQI